MARTARQSKILEIIAAKEIETQEELARELALANFDITQATISRDIKELGLIKVLSENKKYKYAYIDNSTQSISSKHTSVLKEVVISVKRAMNLVVVKVMRGSGNLVSVSVDKLNFENVVGVIGGDECVFIACLTEMDASNVEDKINKLLEE